MLKKIHKVVGDIHVHHRYFGVWYIFLCVFFLHGCECKCLYCFVWVLYVDASCVCFMWILCLYVFLNNFNIVQI
jgi:hypothetical protein